MSIFAPFKAKNWFERRIQSALKNKKIAILTILILISGFFFYNQIISIFPKTFANDYKSEGYLEHEREWMNKIGHVEVEITKQVAEEKRIYPINDRIELKNEESLSKERIKQQLYQLVGGTPIKDMIPAIMKLDYKTGAFIIGIAKKESDWGRHAPSLSGKTCFNYWGYKGQGSRGTSMGYACFGNLEEAVEIVGKRIETLVSKNIDNPKEFVVWKCGSSCAGHDPQGVQKWISDVGLYYGKVMQIQNS
ncbi:MAG: hypothetical protein V1804_01965 [Patescibacteria group bacterium]